MKSYHLYVSPPESRKIVTSKVAVHFAIIPTPKEHLLLFPNFHFNPVLLIATSIGKKTLNSTSVNTSQAEASLKEVFVRKPWCWKHQLQTGRKWRKSTHYCFSTASICFLVLSTPVTLPQTKQYYRWSPRSCTNKVDYYNSNLLHTPKLNL